MFFPHTRQGFQQHLPMGWYPPAAAAPRHWWSSLRQFGTRTRRELFHFATSAIVTRAGHPVWPRRLATLAVGVWGLTAAAAAPCPPEPAQWHTVLPGLAVHHGQWASQDPLALDRLATRVLLWDAQASTVVDPGPHVCSTRALETDRARLGAGPVRRLINSHAHAEHTLANAAWPVPVWATATTGQSMRRRCPDCWESQARALGLAAMQGSRIVWPSRVLRPGQVLPAGGRQWHVLEMRFAHTESDLVLWSPEPGVALVGGLIDARGPLLAQGSVLGWLDALDRIQALGPRWLIGQHRVVGPEAVMTELQTHRQALCTHLRKAWAALDQGLSETEAMAKRSADPDPGEAGSDSPPAMHPPAAWAQQQNLNFARTWREAEALWVARQPLPRACADQPHTSGGN